MLADEIGIPQLDPTLLYTDNRGAMFIPDDVSSANKFRVEARQAVFLQETSVPPMSEEGLFKISHWKVSDNVADIFTKWLPRPAFVKHRAVLLNLRVQRKLGMVPADI